MSKSRKTSKINVPDSISRMIKDHINEEYNLKDKFRGADREDLIQAGLIGFLNAVKKFDPDKGKSIEAYAYKFIVREIQKEAWKTVVGEQNARYAAAVYMAKSELEDNGGSGSNSPDIDQISKRSGVSKQRVEQILAAIACKTYGGNLYENITSHDDIPGEEFQDNNNDNYCIRKKEYGFVFPNIASRLKDKKHELLTFHEREDFAKELSSNDCVYRKRFALKSLSVNGENDSSRLFNLSFKLTLSSDKVAVCQRREIWKNSSTFFQNPNCE
ncbi:sigma-70 family RNA polymerase sigma factor [Lyngbya confervoides]|uniref:RNA polymerase sigma-70 region 2 domain-containing protein n=1 Tax=Lyngbya confervoides BDU141951 TaxID=1574623 RepID=A0ABD4T3U3_9CYAN|nr:sigma factor [Lyngbya confervoides]MCM1983153.1 hypothetical protein [Lyngbya confervoides BDU141951]